MSTFNKLKKLKAVMACIPGIQSYLDYEIILEIGYHHELGDPLTLKRLLLHNLASAATVRRRLAKLVAEGVVLKETSRTDPCTTCSRLMVSWKASSRSMPQAMGSGWFW